VGLNLSFLGGAGTVTGSKYLVEHEKHKLLVDCGLFQGFKALRLKNWASFPVEPGSIDAVILTHAHLDHCGYLPLLIKRGFRGPVYCSRATGDVCAILLPDAGHLQEKDAEFANRHGFSKHKPALPLYTLEDARAALEHLTPIPFDQERTLSGGGTVRLRRSGHILGAGSVQLDWAGITTVFSGDLGRYEDPVMVDPISVERADYLLVESTYGDRRHAKRDPADALAYQLKLEGRLSNVPVFLDSPMALDASEIFCRDTEDHKLSEAECRRACAVARYIRGVEESKALTANPLPKVIISASGMATGGRVLHHLKRYAPDPKNTILFAGFQAGGTRGAAMLSGVESVKIHGEYVPVRAQIRNLDMLSAHADADEIMRWLRGFRAAPRMTFVIHGEASASDALRHRIEEELRWPCMVPDHGQRVELA
jgi:metallo-beta-lactamase family protein